MKSLYDLAMDYNSDLCAQMQVRSDDLNRPLTDEEVVAECVYQLETVDFCGWGDDEDYPEEVQAMKEYKAACRHIIRIGQNRERKAAERAAQN